MKVILPCAFLVLALVTALAAPSPSLTKPIGIITAGNVFSEIMATGTALPRTYSDSFGNAADNQTAVEITIAQKDASGMEKILVAVIDNLPKRPKGKLSVVVTVTVDAKKQLRLKATVPETGYLKQFGPLPVE
jgi:molecular chaperone DnaK (HSP70)